MEKYILIHDESHHWYIIPQKDEERFNDLLYGDDMKAFQDAFWDEYHLRAHVTCYPFYRPEDVEEHLKSCKEQQTPSN